MNSVPPTHPSAPSPQRSAVVAIVGRPNVGKSALFNRIIGRRISIVHAQPGVTRDRIAFETEYQGRSLRFVDTGGIGLMTGETSSDKIVSAVRQQVEIAVQMASVLVYTGDAHDGVTPLDEEIARLLRRSGKPVLVAVNKADNRKIEEQSAGEFSALGFEKLFPVSAIHGIGINDLLDAIVAELPRRSESSTFEGTDPATLLAIVGRADAGQSSPLNAPLRDAR